MKEQIGMNYQQAIYLHNECVSEMNALRGTIGYGAVAHLVYTIRAARAAIDCFEMWMEHF